MRHDYLAVFASRKFQLATLPYVEPKGLPGKQVKLKSGKRVASQKAGYSMPVDNSGVKAGRKRAKLMRLIVCIAWHIHYHRPDLAVVDSPNVIRNARKDFQAREVTAKKSVPAKGLKHWKTVTGTGNGGRTEYVFD